MLIDGLILLLQADPATSALAETRVYENFLPRGYVLPAIVLHQYGGDRDSQMDGPVSIGADQIQFDCYGTTALQTRQVAAAVRDAVNPFVGELPDSDSTVVQLCKLDRDMAMPYIPNADAKGMANRWILGFSITS